jgi:hypothetical protein
VRRAGRDRRPQLQLLMPLLVRSIRSGGCKTAGLTAGSICASVSAHSDRGCGRGAGGRSAVGHQLRLSDTRISESGIFF